MTVLTHKQQTLFRSILRCGMPTQGASLRGIMSIDLDRHTLVQESFVGNHGMKLSKGPLGVHGIGLACLWRDSFCSLAVLLAPVGSAFGALANVCQVFQSNETVWVLRHDTFGNDMIGVLLQPSLSSTDLYQAAGCGTSAFFSVRAKNA